MKMRPLAHRMRPEKIEDVIGQQHLIGEGKPIRRMVQNKRLQSMIFQGPPGTGKTTIARAIAASSDLPYESVNAVNAKKSDLQKIAEKAEKDEKTSVLLYVDEIHRFTKTQVEILLPVIESGDIVLIGSTTESVFHSLPSGIRSRCAIYELYPLSEADILLALERALRDKENGLGTYKVKMDEDTLSFISKGTGGDMRSALSVLESVVVTHGNEETETTIDMSMVEGLMNKKNLGYNGKNTQYDLMSAFQKSIRGSDVNASLYYLGVLIQSGDLTAITRRLLVIADEDIGLSNTSASTHTLTAVTIAERVGFPEARIPLAKIVIELCLSPKSNSAYQALDAAISSIKQGEVGDIPDYLKDAHYAGAKELGRGLTYQYPHDHGGWVNQDYLPEKLKNKRFYEPKGIGHEKQMGELYKKLNERKK